MKGLMFQVFLILLLPTRSRAINQISWKHDRRSKEELKEKPGTSQHWITPSLSGFHHTNLFDLRSVKGIDLYDN